MPQTSFYGLPGGAGYKQTPRKASSNPSTIAPGHLVLWLDATTISGVSDGAALSSWADISGNGNNEAQANASNQPTFKALAHNNKAGVRFNGSSDYMSASFTLNQPVHAFVAFVWNGESGGNGRLFDGAVNRCGLNVNNSNQLVADAGGSLTDTDASSAISTLAKAYIARGLFNDPNSECGVNNLAYATGSAGTSNPGGIRLASFTGGGYYTQIDILELCVYNVALSSSQEAALLNYLDTKWAIY